MHLMVRVLFDHFMAKSTRIYQVLVIGRELTVVTFIISYDDLTSLDFIDCWRRRITVDTLIIRCSRITTECDYLKFLNLTHRVAMS